jgi:aminoglycoside phosphotransferase (APT) family kinase protein
LADTPNTVTLRAAVQRSLRTHFGRPCRIVAFERRASIYTTSFPLEDLLVTLDTGVALPMLFKNISPGAMVPGARQAKPRFLYDPLREIRAYERLLGPHDLGTATCYGAVADARRGHNWLFLEKVAGVEMYQVRTPDLDAGRARWLADMHLAFAAPAVVPASLRSHLLEYDRAFYRRWMTRAERFAAADRSADGRRRGKRLAAIARTYETAIERLLTLPRTVIHGEFYASNVLVQRLGRRLRVCPVDWETTALGPGIIDLAALTEGNWSDADRRSMTWHTGAVSAAAMGGLQA